jgi:hypothetical protein
MKLQPSVQAAMQATAVARSETVTIRENVHVPGEVAHRRQEHQAVDRGATRRRQRGGFGAQGMRHDRMGRPVRPHEGSDRLGALHDRGAPGARSPGSESLWLDRSKAMTRWPASTKAIPRH